MDALTRELRRQLSALDPVPAPRPKREARAVVVRYSVRRPDGGRPFLFEYRAAPGTWRAAAEHDAKATIVRAGLRPWAHLETLEA